MENEILKRIQDYALEEIMGDRFGKYAKEIILDRAIPDVRDGLKPVQRRILYAMYKAGNTSDKGYIKCAATVGDVLGKFHPHGDSSVYDAMVRMSQWWKQNHILVDIHGNNGSMDGDGPAAYRYTEARLAKISNELLKDLDKEKALKIAKQKAKKIEKKADELYKLAVEKGTPVIEKSVNELKQATAEALKKIVAKLEEEEK